MKISQKTVDAIRAEYMPYDRKRGARALAEKYGLRVDCDKQSKKKRGGPTDENRALGIPN